MASDGRETRITGVRRRTAAPPSWPPKDLTEKAAPATHWNGGGTAAPELAEVGIERLRADAIQMGRADAAIGVPTLDRTDPPESEIELQERCRALADRVRHAERRRAAEDAGRLEDRITEHLPRARHKLDRFERLANDLTRLRVRRKRRKREVAQELKRELSTRARGIPTKIYIAAIGFLGLVEFFANAPVFSSLLPRDPLSERQIRILLETVDGWFSGAERVMAHIVMRPDAALLAGGVIAFLLVMAHFFGHSLRSLVIQQDRRARKDTVAARSALENLVPIVITGVGLALAIGVLYEARVMLGNVGQERYVQDMAQVEELRREAGWLRGNGDLLAANERTNRAEDMEAAALALREYSASMARMNFQILLLNLTLVLCAIAVAYFHTRDSRTERFNEDAFEDERNQLVDAAEAVAAEIGPVLAEMTRDIRRLQSALNGGNSYDLSLLVPQLEAIITLYRTENGRARGLDTSQIAAFRTPVTLGIDAAAASDGHSPAPTAQEYEKEYSAIQGRFESVRSRFADEVRA